MILGLTGGICTGKSVATAVIKRLGIRVIDADEISRYLTAYDPLTLERIRAELGAECFHAGGALDRQKLGDIVFSDSELKARLEGILHPPIMAVVDTNIALVRKLSQHAVFVAPLLIEAGVQDRVDQLWVISCSPDKQVERLCQRLGIGAAEALKWINAQMPLDQKESHADNVLVNDGTIDEFQRLVEQEWKQLVANT